MISFNCSACGQALKVSDELAGKKGKCPHCQQPVTVPSPAGRLVASRAEVDATAGARPPEARSVGGEAERSTCGADASQFRTIPPGAVPAGASREHYDFLSPPQQPDELGRLGPYRVLKVLGAGGMGVVFQAEDPSLDRKVALKAMLPTLAGSESARLRFLREAKTAAAIEHDHIVPIFQVGQDRGVPFIAMPFLKGMPLDERLRREPILPLAETLRIGRETAKGLAAAHEAGLIHRDIKPANLWLEGAEGRVKILDFGLARAAADNAQLTQSGAIMGTPAYMAPEQASGKTVDARCDLFALGCVLYRLCTGEMPFKGPDAISTLMAVTTEQPGAPAEVNPATPPALSDLVMRLLAKNPADRPASAASVVREIQAIEGGLAGKRLADSDTAPPNVFSEITIPTPEPPRRPTGRGSGRWRRAALAAGLLSLAVVAAVIVLQVTGDRGEGTVTIETVDPDVEVTISGNGRSFTIKDRKTKQEVTLPVGKYEVELKGGKGSLKLETPRFTLKRGKQEVVRVTWQEGKRPAPEKTEADFKSLFNGKDLTGWSADGYCKEVEWKIEQGAIAITGGPWNTWGFLLSKKEYSSFILRLQFQLEKGAKSGIALRAVPGARVGNYPYHFKVNLQHDANTGAILWADDARSYHGPDRPAKLKEAGEWNQLELTLRGQSLRVSVNDNRVLDVVLDSFADRPGVLAALKRSSGRIGLQKHTGVARFRNIELKELPTAEGFFNGKDLSGWEGLNSCWSVKDGAIVGSSFPDGISFNTFLYSKKQYTDFELTFRVKLTGQDWPGNSGVQIRSEIFNARQFAVKGPQADMGGDNWGSLYGERFGGMMKQADKAKVEKVFKKEDFNDYSIKVVGKHVRIQINGETTVDEDFPTLPATGVVAWQIHGGKPMEVVFKDIRFRALK